MAIRLRNTSAAPLNVELGPEESFVLAPGATSQALREEALYYNDYVAEWERRGMIVRVPEKMKEVLKVEQEQTEHRLRARGIDPDAVAAAGAKAGKAAAKAAAKAANVA